MCPKEVLNITIRNYRIYFFKSIYLSISVSISACIVACFPPVAQQTGEDACRAHHSPSHASKRTGTTSLLLFIAMPPAESLVLQGSSSLNVRKSFWKMKSTHRKAEIQRRERESCGPCLNPQILSWLKPT